MSKPLHVVLMGLMGSGKSTIGRPLARRLGRQYVDNDRQLELRTGQTAHELAAAVGMDELHRDEAETLLASLARAEPAVVSAPASAITDARAPGTTRRRVRGVAGPPDRGPRGAVPPPEQPAGDGQRPRRGPRPAVHRARPLYRQVARLVVHPADGTDVQQLVEQIAGAVTATEAGSEDGRR